MKASSDACVCCRWSYPHNKERLLGVTLDEVPGKLLLDTLPVSSPHLQPRNSVIYVLTLIREARTSSSSF